MKLRFIFTMVSCIQIAVAEEVILQFDQANQLYRSGEVQKAMETYEYIISSGFESPELYYNLGNVYFKLNNIPAAILNYERAKRLAPNDEDISYNLRLSTLRIVDKIDPIPQFFFVEWWYGLINMNSADGWAVLGIGSLWGAALTGFLFLIARSTSPRRITFSVALLCILLSVVSFVGVVHRAFIEQNEQTAVIFSPSISVKSAPDEQSTDLFILHEGVKVELLDSVADWKKIRLADGKIGWLPAKVLQVI